MIKVLVFAVFLIVSSTFGATTLVTDTIAAVMKADKNRFARLAD